MFTAACRVVEPPMLGRGTSWLLPLAHVGKPALLVVSSYGHAAAARGSRDCSKGHRTDIRVSDIRVLILLQVALVEGARQLGFEFRGRTRSHLTVNFQGREVGAGGTESRLQQ